MSSISKLSKQMPVQNQRVATGIRRAGDIALQQAGGQIGNIRQAQQVGAQAAAATGQQTAQAEQAKQNRATQLGQLGLAQQSAKQQQTQNLQAETLAKRSADASSKIFNLAREADKQKFEEQLEFKKQVSTDNNLNEHQLLDWKLSQAKSQQEFQNAIQQANQAHEQKISHMKSIQANLEFFYRKKHKITTQELSQQHQQNLAKLKQDMQKRITEAENKAKNKAAIGSAIGGLAGSYFGPVGAAAGSAVGTAIASQV